MSLNREFSQHILHQFFTNATDGLGLIASEMPSASKFFDSSITSNILKNGNWEIYGKIKYSKSFSKNGIFAMMLENTMTNEYRVFYGHSSGDNWYLSINMEDFSPYDDFK